MRALAGFLLLASLGAAQGQAQAQGAFDGTWDVTVVCPEARGASGFTLRFPATVQNSNLAGAYQPADSPSPALQLAGRINPDGTASLEASGVITNPQAAVRGSAGRGTPYRYTVDSRFTGNRGTGQRIQTRVCTYTFVKR